MGAGFLSRIVASLTVTLTLTLAATDPLNAQGSWVPFGSNGASDVAVNPSGVVWLIGREPHSIRSTLVLAETQFYTPAGSPARVAVDLNGFPWLLNTNGAVWHYVRSGAGKEEWVLSSLKAIDIAVGASGAVWAVDNDHHVARLNNGTWESIGGSARRIAVDPAGNPWIVTPSGQVSRWIEGSWKQLEGSATDISIAPDGGVFILGSTPVRGGFEVFRLNGVRWDQVDGGAGIAIAAGSRAVYVAQDTTTNAVLLTPMSHLRVVSAGSTSVTSQGTSPAGSSIAAPKATTDSRALPAGSAGSSTDPSRGTIKETSEGASLPLPSVSAVGGAVGGLLGVMGGVAGVGARVVPPPTSIVAVVPIPMPPVGAVTGAIGSVISTAGGVLSGSPPSGGAAAAPGPAASPTSPASTGNPARTPEPNRLEEAKIPGTRPSFKLPLPGSLKCPIIGNGALLERACEMGRDALKLRIAPSSSCESPSFSDPRNGGECWTCPLTFVRSTAPVDSADACAQTGSGMHSFATLVKGCATSKVPPGYGTPFRDSPNGSECYVCPLPLKRSWSTITNLSKANIGACLGKAKDLLVWQLGQYPEEGAYRFMPGLLSSALSDPKAVDEFLNIRANGDTAVKRIMWAKMIGDPSSSAELKALLFASLLKAAQHDGANDQANDALREFESYMRARRVYVANEALRMYEKAREVARYAEKLNKNPAAIRTSTSAAVETANTDFKTYAWSAVLPDSAGTDFILASSTLSALAAGRSIAGVSSATASSLNSHYLEPVTKALTSQLDSGQDGGSQLVDSARAALATVRDIASQLKGADRAMIATTLLSGAMKFSKGFMNIMGKDKLAAEYAKYVEEMKTPLRVKEMLESSTAEDKQTLLLYWSLATSPYKASEKIGTGALTGADLCSSDSWTAAACSSAKTMVQAAAKAAGYVNQPAGG